MGARDANKFIQFQKDTDYVLNQEKARIKRVKRNFLIIDITIAALMIAMNKIFVDEWALPAVSIVLTTLSILFGIFAYRIGSVIKKATD